MIAIAPRDGCPYSDAGMGYANPHAVTGMAYTGGATTTYAYDNNGNLTTVGNRGHEWDWGTSAANAIYVNMYYNIASSLSIWVSY